MNDMSGIYIHIPFCRKRCNYCDFFFTTNTKLVAEFVESLMAEFSQRSREFMDLNFDSIFFGGGTPSILSSDDLNRILNELKQNFSISDDAEISLEANPEDLDKSTVDYIAEAGVNRLSIGVQSFLAHELEFLTRSHTPEFAEDVLRNACRKFRSVGADIIYSLPGQSASEVYYSLEKAINCGVNHISAYTLTFEEKTLLGKSLRDGTTIQNSPESEGELFESVSLFLKERGFLHYEISNFALPGFECRHNMKYWNLSQYIGFGPSAHSFTGNRRWSNLSNLKEYTTALKAGKLPVSNEHTLNKEEIKSDYLMLAIRSLGIDPEDYRKKFGSCFETDFSGSLNLLISTGKINFDGNRYRLTLEGYAIADEIVARYF